MSNSVSHFDAPQDTSTKDQNPARLLESHQTSCEEETIDLSYKTLYASCFTKLQTYLHEASHVWCCFSTSVSEKLSLPSSESHPSKVKEHSRPSTPPCVNGGVEQHLPPLGFSFSPAGLLLPYHLGVLHCLNYFGVITADVPLAGASAGAIAVASAGCNVGIMKIMDLFFQVQNDLRVTGAARKLHVLLEKQLNEMLSSNSHQTINTRPAPVTIAYATVWPRVKGHFPNQFHSYTDLKECIIASCNIPFYFSHWPTVSCRGSAAVDGYFASTRTFGCPKTGAKRDIWVIPFSPTAMHLPVSADNCISPDLQKDDDFYHKKEHWEYLKLYQEYIDKYPVVNRKPSANMVENNVIVDAHTSSTSRRSSIKTFNLLRQNFKCSKTSTESLSSEQTKSSREFGTDSQTDIPRLPVLTYSLATLFKIALDPVSEFMLIEIFNLGRADSYRWLIKQVTCEKNRLLLNPCTSPLLL